MRRCRYGLFRQPFYTVEVLLCLLQLQDVSNCIAKFLCFLNLTVKNIFSTSKPEDARIQALHEQRVYRITRAVTIDDKRN